MNREIAGLNVEFDDEGYMIDHTQWNDDIARILAQEEGIKELGSIVVLGNVPCIRCGYGDECPMSGIKMLHGPDATVESIGVRAFQDDPELAATAAELGEKIRRAVLGSE